MTTTGQTINETGQLYVGQQTGLMMMTRTAHPLKFLTYSDQTGVGTIPTSVQILATGSRDVQIISPLRCLAPISTFDSAITLGGSLSVDTVCLSCNASSTFSGNTTVGSTAILKANQIRINGSNANDGVIIQNVDGTEIAKFHNTTAVRLNGDTTILGNLSISGSLSGYSPFWVAGRIDGSIAGAVPTVVTRKGDYGSQITCTRASGYPIGVFVVSWTTAHSDGVNWIGRVSGEGSSYHENLNSSGPFVNTSTSLTCIFRKLYATTLEALVDCPFTFFVLK